MKRLHRLKTAALALALTATLFAASASSAVAQVITSLDDIQYWVGSGSNRAGLVIDWKDNQNPTSFAWGFRWDGTATGEDMLRAIAGLIGTNTTPATPDASGDPALTLYTQFFGGGLGNAVYELDYFNHAEGGFEGGSVGYWAYYTADNSPALPATWTFSDIGMGTRTLGNNSWDAWTWAVDFDATVPFAPVNAVPEPGTWLLLALGAGVLCWQVRRRRTARNA